MLEPFISIRNMSKSFSGKYIIKNFNLDIHRGERIVIIGPSGCGKSTLLRLILGLQKPDDGDIWIDGVNVAKLSYHELKPVRMKIGMLFQSAALFDSMTVSENVAFSLYENLQLHPIQIRKKVIELLSKVEMLEFEDVMPSNLSGGQRKRVGLARAIATNPEMLLYDEPTTGLDPRLSTNIEDLIVKMSRQLDMTSIVVSHQKSTILRTGDKIYMMHQGRLLDAVTPNNISQNGFVKDFVNGIVTNELL